MRTEFHLLPVLVAGYTATSTGKVNPIVASVACLAVILVSETGVVRPGERGDIP